MKVPVILVVDDEPQILRVMRTTLGAQGYEVVTAQSGEEALDSMRQTQPDLVLLDMNMPGMGGLQTCRAIRVSCEAPVIVLSIRNSEIDKVDALDAGADDYVTKPFSFRELAARIRAALRRGAPSSSPPQRIVLADLEIDFTSRKVNVRGKPVRLTPTEFDLLRHLVANKNRPVPHRQLLQTIWGPEYIKEVEYLRVFINQLRKKIEPDLPRLQYILTEPRLGYRFAMPEVASVVRGIGDSVP